MPLLVLAMLLLACGGRDLRKDDDSAPPATGADADADADADTDADADADTDTDTDVTFTDVPPVDKWFKSATTDSVFALYGTAEDDRFGEVGAAGDLDGDGLADLAATRIGRPPSAIGPTWLTVVYGSRTWAAPTQATFTFEAGDAPRSPTGVGDVTGDGAEDLALCTPGSAEMGLDAGVAWVLPGGERWSGAQSATALAAARVTGRPGQQVCGVIAPAADLTGDGAADLLLGGELGEGGSSAGAVWVMAGPLAGDLHTDDAAVTLTGVAEGDYAGASLALGDLNGDGVRDLAVGAVGAGVLVRSGTVDVVLGPITSGSLADADYDLFGVDGNDRIGDAGSLAVGDIDGDGRADLLIGASGDEENELLPNHGTVFVVYGQDLYTAPVSSVARTRFFGLRHDHGAGTSVRAADLDNDGDDEVVFGAPDQVGLTSGAIYLFDDPSTGRYSAGEADGLVVGGNFADRLGTSIAVAGDVDGDFDKDLWVGARDADRPSGAPDVGAAFLLLSGVAP